MGWQEKPDTHMAKYIMSTIGRDEGFNNNVDITSNNKDVSFVPPVVNILYADKAGKKMGKLGEI